MALSVGSATPSCPRLRVQAVAVLIVASNVRKSDAWLNRRNDQPEPAPITQNLPPPLRLVVVGMPDQTSPTTCHQQKAHHSPSPPEPRTSAPGDLAYPKHASEQNRGRSGPLTLSTSANPTGDTAVTPASDRA